MENHMTICGREYEILRLLGHGKGGYSYLARCGGENIVVKQIHHEPCDYYQFGNKLEAERRDYERLKATGIRVPEMLAVDEAAERIVKEYIEGETVFELVKNGASAEPYLPQVREMAARAKEHGLNIDYFPTNFVIRGGLLWYVDYECNDYMEEWNFENWGVRYWFRTEEFEAYLKQLDRSEGTVLYVHGKGGTAAESEHYKELFPDRRVLGLDYQTFTPWDTGEEIRRAAEQLKGEGKPVVLIANSIGAYFSLCAGLDGLVEKAYFISPIVDMEKLICDMMLWAGVSEDELRDRGVIHTAFGEDLSWEYLQWVRNHPVEWHVPTKILYGSADNLTNRETVERFAGDHGAALTVMEGGEHWFHTPEQMAFLDDWIRNE